MLPCWGCPTHLRPVRSEHYSPGQRPGLRPRAKNHHRPERAEQHAATTTMNRISLILCDFLKKRHLTILVWFINIIVCLNSRKFRHLDVQSKHEIVSFLKFTTAFCYTDITTKARSWQSIHGEQCFASVVKAVVSLREGRIMNLLPFSMRRAFLHKVGRTSACPNI